MTDRPLQKQPEDTNPPPEGWLRSMKGGTLMEWVGDEPATVEDARALKEWDSDATADNGTLVGTLDKGWNSEYWNANKDKEVYYRDCPGGVGSIHYEYQKVGGENNGVRFAKEPIWHYDADNELVKGDSPPGNAGEYHEAWLEDGHKNNYVGPEPESKAEEVLGEGEYYWDEEAELYGIK